MSCDNLNMNNNDCNNSESKNNKNSKPSPNNMRDNNNNKYTKNNCENKHSIDKGNDESPETNKDRCSIDSCDDFNDFSDLNDVNDSNDETIKKLPIECQELFYHVPEYTIGKNGNGVTFKPSPYLNKEEEKKDQDSKKKKTKLYGMRRRSKRSLRRRKKSSGMTPGEDNDDNSDSDDDSDEEEFEPKFTDAEGACLFVARTMNCNIEATFTDHIHGNDNENDNDELLKLKDVKILKESYQMHHGFLHAAEIAWKEHLGLKIEPIHIWLMILQGIAMHVEYNSQLLRQKWVNFDGKKKLVVNRDDFVKGQRELNNWSEVIESFCHQIDKNTAKDCVSLLESDFSNSTQVDKIATKITIMDICKSYFEFVVRTRCGFKHITLNGTKNDWIKIYKKTKKLLEEKVEPNWGKEWSKALLPILKRFIVAFDGKIDCLFWNSMIKRGARHGSGGWTWYSGWINVFFPYIKENKNKFCVKYCNTNDYILNGLKKSGEGNDINNYPYGLSCAPVKWEYYSCDINLKFLSGFIGVKVQFENDKKNEENIKELSAMIGWIIGEDKEEKQANLEALADIASKEYSCI